MSSPHAEGRACVGVWCRQNRRTSCFSAVSTVPARISMEGRRMKPSSAGSTSGSRSRHRLAFEAGDSVADYDALLTRIPIIDHVLDGHASALGNDFVAYRNHVYRVVNLCVAIVGGRGELEKIATAAVFHDLGIWTDRTFDYLAPSITLACDYLVVRGREDWIADIEEMIANHHKITPSTTTAGSLVEPFRKADWIDVTRGLRRFGVRYRFIA